MTDAAARFLLTVRDATRAGFASAEAGARRFAANVGGALGKLGIGGGLGLSALTIGLGKVVKDSIAFGDEIAKAAARAGLGVEAFSRLASAAGQSDIELGTLSKALQTMQLGLAKTSDSAGEFADELKNLGISALELRKLNQDEQFLRLADAIGKVEDVQQRTLIGTKVFGKSFAELAPAIEGGAEALRELTDNAKIFRTELTEQQVKALTDADDGINKLTESLKGLGLQFAAAVAPGVTAFTEFTQQILGTLTPLQEIETKLRLLRDAQDSIPIVFDFLGKIDDGKFIMGPEAIKKAIDELVAKRDELLKKKPGANPPINDQIDVEEFKPKADFSGLRLRDPEGLRDSVKSSLDQAFAEFEGEDLRERALARDFGEIRGERRDRLLEEDRAYFEELQAKVEENAEQSVQASEEILDQFSERLGEKVMERNDFLAGATEEFGRSVQNSLSDVFFNAGKGADKFADSVLNAFKRILADAAAQKVVQLLTGLGGSGKTGSTGGGSGGIFGAVLGAFLGGARAEGGPVSSGLGYLVGEKGPELFMPRQSGSIVPNSSLRGAAPMNIDARVYVDARGATKDGAAELTAQLPRILDQRDRRLRDGIREDINRGRFGLK